MQSRHAITREEAERLAKWVEGLNIPFTLSVTPGGKRSLNANALFHRWMSEIAHWYGDRTASDVKGQTHMHWAVGIRCRDPQFEWLWERATRELTYEQKCKVCESGIFAISSGMTTPEMREYMDEIKKHYTSAGVTLTEPEWDA